MPTLTVNIAYDAPGSAVTTDPDQVVRVQALTDVVQDVGGVTYTIEPWPIELELVDGQGSVVLDAGYYWVHRYGESKLVNLVTDARLDQLASIDPATLDTEAPLTPAWQAELALRPILVRLTQAEYDALTPAEQTDPLKLYVIPAIA